MSNFIKKTSEFDIDLLHKLNVDIKNAEKESNATFLQSVLASELIFRRANGQVVDRTTYLADLLAEGNHYSMLEIIEPFNIMKFDCSVESQATAMASLIIHAAGVRNGKPFSGIFRNHRLFCQGGSQGWQCVIWYNTRIGDI